MTDLKSVLSRLDEAEAADPANFPEHLFEAWRFLRRCLAAWVKVEKLQLTIETPDESGNWAAWLPGGGPPNASILAEARTPLEAVEQCGEEHAANA